MQGRRFFRKLVVGVVVGIALIMAAFPPWIYLVRTIGTPPDHYAWFVQPHAERLSKQERVNIEKLVWQYIFLVSFAAVTLFVIRDWKPIKPSQD
jgi:hypothetical protein